MVKRKEKMCCTQTANQLRKMLHAENVLHTNSKSTKKNATCTSIGQLEHVIRIINCKQELYQKTKQRRIIQLRAMQPYTRTRWQEEVIWHNGVETVSCAFSVQARDELPTNAVKSVTAHLRMHVDCEHEEPAQTWSQLGVHYFGGGKRFDPSPRTMPMNGLYLKRRRKLLRPTQQGVQSTTARPRKTSNRS